jgi:hypothetical protein
MADTQDALVEYWKKEIDLAKKRERSFRKEAERVQDIYEAKKEGENNFNILYANTATLLPAVYNQTPRPIVERRFHDADPLGKAAADAAERSLEYLMDTPTGGYEAYDDLFRQAALGACVPGRGVTRWRYDPEIESKEGESVKAEEAEDLAEEEEVTGQLVPKRERVVWETVCGQDIDYDKFLHGYARRWVDVPWVAYEHAMSKEDAEANFGKDIANEMKFIDQPTKDALGNKVEDADDSHNRGSTPVACVYEIWWKQKRKIVFFDPELKEKLCLQLDDPYGLAGFFDCPEPLRFWGKRSTLVPTPLYKAYETQARQLNRITMRIARVTNAMKVRGFYDGTIQGLKELLSSDDNTLIPAKNVAAMQQGQNLQNSIWTMPLEQLAGVLEGLYKAQENAKDTIYEITGIADIMRGDTQASETATAQNIKDKWGSLRLQDMQNEMQRYVRDSLRIVAELACEHFGPETFAGMTNLDYAMPQEVQQAQQVMQQVQMMQLQAQQMAPPMQPGPQAPGAPAQPPPMPPQLEQMAQQAQAILAKPQWEQVLGVLKNDLMRGYRIDIETNSTLANTSGEDQQNINLAMQSLSSMYQNFLPAVQQGAMTMPALKEMTLSVARRFEFGRQVEAAVASMPDQLPPPPPDPKVDQALAQQKMDLMQKSLELEKSKGELANREAMLAMREKQIAQQVKEADSNQKVSQTDFLMQMEKRLSKHEMLMQKGVQQQKMMQDEHTNNVKNALATHGIKVKETVAAGKKPEPAPIESGLVEVTKSLIDVVKELKSLQEHRAAPIKIVHGKDGRAAQVVVGGTTRVVKRGPNGDIELH